MKECQRSGWKGRAVRPAARSFSLFFRFAWTLMAAFPAAAQAPPPDLDYFTLRTEHFRITYPEGLGALVPRAAATAERAHALLIGSFFPAPAGPIDLLLTDHTDFSNGFARVTPSSRITIWVHPPLDGLALSHFDEWLELVITHEVAHVFQLDYTGRLGRALRSLFGRPSLRWPYFAGYTLPQLAIEGVAVELESRYTLAGRAHGTLFDAVVRARVIGAGPEPLSTGLSASPIWPGGERPYVYGSLFFDFLAERHGAGAVALFLREAADQWIPYRLDAAARVAFGASFTGLWTDWMAEVVEEAFALESRTTRHTLPSVEILTEGAREAFHAAPHPGGRGVAYLRDDGRSDPRLVLRTAEGERTLTRWNGAPAPPRWTRQGTLLLPDAEFMDRYRIQRDLYEVTLSGEVTRVTSGMRVIHADPHPGEGPIAAVLGGEGTTRLALLSNEGAFLRSLRESEPGVYWSFPAWSPTGDRLAVIRRRPGGMSAVLVLDTEGALLHLVVEDRSLNTAPAWAPDGSALLWGSDRSGVANLYGVIFGEGSGAPGEPRQITDLLTAGTFPAVDPAGDWIYLSVLWEEGWELARVPFDPEGWFTPLPELDRFALGPGEPSPGAASGPPATAAPVRYSSFPTLLPRYWLPIYREEERVADRRVLREGWGIETSGTDLLERHGYSAWIAALFSREETRVEWNARYRWAGLGNPVLSFETGQEWDAQALVRVPHEEGEPVDSLLPILRERHYGVAAELRRQGVRRSVSLTLGARLVSTERRLFELDGAESGRYGFVRPESDLIEARVALSFSTARSHPFSVSTESGARATLSLRERWDHSVPDSLSGDAGADGGFREAVVSGQLFRPLAGPGYANQVLALRLAGGGAEGPGTGTGQFSVGGISRFFSVRGHDSGGLRGDQAWSASAEWRFPLGIVNRGLGSWPAYLDRVAAGVFFDAGGARTAGDGGGTSWETVASVGAEVVFSAAFFWEGLDRIRLGTALPLESSPQPTAYFRAGWSF
ncbi:MAG: hypothetical protein WEG36_00965 [Gemmatimonadota bacterium]